MLSNHSLRVMMNRFSEINLRVDMLNLSGNVFDTVDELVNYLWASDVPIHALSLRNNRLKGDQINAILRCCYNHEK